MTIIECGDDGSVDIASIKIEWITAGFCHAIQRLSNLPWHYYGNQDILRTFIEYEWGFSPRKLTH